jgi:branched-chain amino acid transport system substrate-binding protein
MFEQSGTLAPFGEATGDGVKMAVQEINEAGGFQVGDTVYTIELVERDTRSEINQTVAVATELIRDEQLNVIWGPASIGEPEATARSQPEEVLHICACQQREENALATEEQAQGESHWAFQTLPALTTLFPAGARNVAEDFPELETFGILCSNDQTGANVCNTLVSAYETAGFELVNEGRQDFPPTTTDYRPFLTTVRTQNPDILLNYVDPQSQINLLKQAIELDVGDYFGAVALPANLLESLVGPEIRDIPVGVGGYPRQGIEPTSEEAAAYFDKYAAYKGGVDKLPLVPFVSLLQYDFVYMLAAAMQQAGTVEDTTAISDALEVLHYNGVGEDDIYFDERHIGVMGSDGCTLFQGNLTCEHTSPQELFEAAEEVEDAVTPGGTDTGDSGGETPEGGGG